MSIMLFVVNEIISHIFTPIVKWQKLQTPLQNLNIFGKSSKNISAQKYLIVPIAHLWMK
jgi:hypothetical protein